MVNKLLISLLVAAAATTPSSAIEIFSSEYVLVNNHDLGFYTFSQGGFSGGASISGSFSAFDNNADSEINFFNGEVFDFTGSFSGNSLVPFFSFTNGGLIFRLNDSNILGDDLAGGTEGIIAFSSGAPEISWRAGPGPFNFCDGTSACGVISFEGGSLVPEPVTWAMLITGFGLVGAARRRQRAIAA